MASFSGPMEGPEGQAPEGQVNPVMDQAATLLEQAAQALRAGNMEEFQKIMMDVQNVLQQETKPQGTGELHGNIEAGLK